MKRTLAVICAAMLMLSLSACGQRVPDYALGTVWGEITKISGTKVTLTLGEVTEDNAIPEMPGGNADGTPPEMPDDSAGGTPPEKTGGRAQRKRRVQLRQRDDCQYLRYKDNNGRG